MPAFEDQENISRRPTWAEIDLNQLAANFNQIKKRVSSTAHVMAVVKANAYGHGAIECARRLAGEGADWFGVALPEEAIQLRNAGIAQPILCLAGFWLGQAPACIQHKLTSVVYRLDMIEALDHAARDAGVIADVHVKVDTGMGRLGVRFDQLAEFVAALDKFRNVRIDGLMTHLAAADDAACRPLTLDQIRRFDDALALFRRSMGQPRAARRRVVRSVARRSAAFGFGSAPQAGDVRLLADNHVEVGATGRDDWLRLHL
jgi:alanine racemase